ncbi:hypothetical protein OWV82_016816 [Melia azedarach]|uniref:Uncharacterized protein n=1 Tax=Melia azedarach TaxID=155640 RepID=A0ACC1XIV0_MELAZ|nr:hypothetical protein OWV82_016816 [Melia azedarach]
MNLSGTCLTFYHRFLSGTRSFFKEEHHEVNPNTTPPSRNPAPAPSISISVSTFEPQVSLNSTSSTGAEARVASPSPAFPNHPFIINSPCKGQERLTVGSSSTFASSSSTVYEAKKAKPPWVPDSYKLILNTSSPGHESDPIPRENESSACMDQNSEQTVFHPIIWILQDSELGRHLLLLAVPMIIALYTIHNPKIIGTTVSLSLGVALICNRILLHKTWPNLSNLIELLGVAFMLMSFYRFVACSLPSNPYVDSPIVLASELVSLCCSIYFQGESS